MPRTLTALPNESRISVVDVASIPAFRCKFCMQQPAGDPLLIDASLTVDASSRVKVFAAELHICAPCIRAAHESIEKGHPGHYVKAPICLFCLANDADWTSPFFLGPNDGYMDGFVIELDGQRMELSQAGICQSCANEAVRKLNVETNARKKKELQSA